MIEAGALLAASAMLWLALLALVRAVRGPAAGVRRAARQVALAAVAAMAVAVVAFRLSDARGWQAFGRIVPRVETDERRVALTFDDGPTPAYTDSILAVLGGQGVRATFFLNGASIVRNAAAASKIAAAGHEIGNHTWTHPHMLLRSVSFTRAQVERTYSAIRALGGDGEILFRPPYGKKLIVLPWLLARSGRTSVTWDVEPESHAEVASSPERIVAHVRERVRPGSIVLLHVMFAGGEASRAAVPEIIRTLRADGYAFVTVSELLASGTTAGPAGS